VQSKHGIADSATLYLARRVANLVQSDAQMSKAQLSVLRDESQGSAALYSFWRSLISNQQPAELDGSRLLR
jgi:myo-inositol catabolism protein IolC